MESADSVGRVQRVGEWGVGHSAAGTQRSPGRDPTTEGVQAEAETDHHHDPLCPIEASPHPVSLAERSTEVSGRPDRGLTTDSADASPLTG